MGSWIKGVDDEGRHHFVPPLLGYDRPPQRRDWKPSCQLPPPWARSSSLRSSSGCSRCRQPLLLVPSFHEKSSGLHGDLQLLWLVLVGVDPDLHPGVVLFHLGLLLVYKLLNSLNWLSRFLLGTIQSSFHLLLKKESAKAPLMLNEEKVLMLWAIFSSLVFGLAWLSSLRFSLWNSH